MQFKMTVDLILQGDDFSTSILGSQFSTFKGQRKVIYISKCELPTMAHNFDSRLQFGCGKVKKSNISYCDSQI